MTKQEAEDAILTASFVAMAVRVEIVSYEITPSWQSPGHSISMVIRAAKPRGGTPDKYGAHTRHCRIYEPREIGPELYDFAKSYYGPILP
jgi:hypothetical protein